MQNSFESPVNNPPVEKQGGAPTPREGASKALEGLDAALTENILHHPELIDTLSYINSREKKAGPAFFKDIQTIDRDLGNKYLVEMARKDLLPKTRVEHVVGAPNGDEELALASHRFDLLEKKYLKLENHREASPEEKTIIKRSIENINTLREKHGLLPASLSPERVNIINSESIETGIGSVDGIDAPLWQRDLIAAQGKEDAVKFNSIQHELFHGGSYQALQHHEGETTDYRLGLQVHSRKNNDDVPEIYLNPLNEAVTEENARRFTLSIKEDDHELGYIAKKRNEAFQKLTTLYNEKPDKIVDPKKVEILGIDTERGIIQTSSYAEERQTMWKLFDKIYEHNPGTFPGKTKEEAREEMFDLATKTVLSGDMLPLGRLMNDTFGLNTFRIYGHLKTSQDINVFLDSLDTNTK